ncbi:MAG: HAMP domain-containing histidine kinase [Oscillospiraceae bacterium]|jgi:signal transduction histidine kinase|nr:HAMP domain-containing histidine kinase [Oscillospiraceae bacterium]
MSKRRQKKKMTFSNRLFGGIALIMLGCIVAIVLFDTQMTPFIYIFQAGWSLYDTHSKVIAVADESAIGSEEFARKMATLEKSRNVSVEIFNGKQRGDPARKLLYSTEANNKGLSGDALQGAEWEYDIQNYRGDVLRRYDGTENGAVDLSGFNKGDFYFEFRRLVQDEPDGEEQPGKKVSDGYLVIVINVRDGQSHSSEPLYTIELYKLRSTLDEGSRFAIMFVFVLSIFLFGLALVVSLVFAKRFSRPLTQISDITEKLVRLDFSEQCPPSKIKEISELSENINAMTRALDASLQDLRQRNEKLREDIENERTIEHLRTGFITNVSHELKTPIAIIQGYAEGLKLFIDEDIDMAKRYCNVIIDETAGMHVMVMKLLEIIKYDSGDYRPDYEAFSLHEMVGDWFVRNAQILEEKGVLCKNDVPEGPMAYGDSMLLSSVLNNYLSNALSHVAGEKKIIARMEEQGERYRVFIYNSGEHIAAKDIEKIWTSFYRADKAMSRAEGRFGLGLAIVQSIQRLHENECGVYNDDGGVTFWFDVKKGDPDEAGEG